MNQQERLAQAQNKLRTVVDDALMLSGALKYTIYENYRTNMEELREAILAVNPKALPRGQSVHDLIKKLDKGMAAIHDVAQTLEIRFIHEDHVSSSQNKQFGLHQIFRALRGMSEDQIFNLYVQATADTTDHNFELTNRMSVVKFLDKVLDKARKSNQAAVDYVSDYHRALTQIDADAIIVKDDGNVLVYDIAPEREEIQDSA